VERLFFQGRELKMSPLCDRCGERLRGEQEREDARRRFESRLEMSRLPQSRYAVELPEGPHGEAARLWADGELRGLMLLGPVGVGKTHLAAAAVWRRLRSDHVRWVRVARLMSQLRAGFDDEPRREALAIINGASALVLDDLDKANPTDFGREVVFNAVDSRVEHGSPLLVTTNLELSAIGERYGEPVASRLAGYCRVLRMTGEDRRIGGIS
jgi:DNA replication protein DnaC